MISAAAWAAEAPDLVVGVDAGGSRTRLAIARADRGLPLAIGEAGGANLNFAGTDGVRTALTAAWNAACVSLPSPLPPLRAAFLGLAGVASAAGHDTIRTIAGDLLGIDRSRIGVDHDLRIAHAGAFQGGPGIVVIGGTGSAAYGRRSDGSDALAGGYGPLIDDAGAGYWIAREALSAIVRAADGRARPTALAASLLDALAISRVDALVRRLHHPPASRADVAALAPLVLHAADNGDATAAEIVDRGAAELARLAAAVGDRLFQDLPAQVALAGTLARTPGYERRIAAALHTCAPRLALTEPAATPVDGALLLARSLLETLPRTA